jgi:hypothetical protein
MQLHFPIGRAIVDRIPVRRKSRSSAGGYLRAETNSLLMEDLQEYEQGEATRLDGITREWDKARADPNDVFFAARDRREEIKEQMKELQEALTRDPQRSPGSERRSSKQRGSGRSAKRRPKATKS